MTFPGVQLSDIGTISSILREARIAPYHDKNLLEIWGGAECTINRNADRYLDQIELSGHHLRDDDLKRFASLGIAALRYPLLWETFEKSHDPERLWAWHDTRLGQLRSWGVRPIIGLVHHGSGPPNTNLLSDDFTAGLAAHAATAAARFPWVGDWTPINEPLTTARFSALYGLWYPHLCDETAFWRALLVQIEAVKAAMRQIRAVIPNARLIQTEDLGHTGSTPELQMQADFDNERRWASWDMLVGTFVPGHALWDHVASLGLAKRLETNACTPCTPELLGLNHYLTSDRFLDHRLERHPFASHGHCPLGQLADVEAVRVCEQPPGLEGALRACWERYGLPLALTEVHNGCTREEQMRWIVEAWNTSNKLRGEGAGIEAITIWSLLGAKDWDSLLTRVNGHYESGVFDIRSNPPRETALAPLIRSLSQGRDAVHPVLCNTGWWRNHVALASPTARTASSTLCARPLLITGATGTLGQAFAGACRLRGIDHVLTDRGTLDLNDSGSISRTLDELRPWAVINAAGWVRVDEAEERMAECLAANHSGALALAAACCIRDIHYTCFSSDLVFDGQLNRSYLESDPPSPLSIYGHSKASTDMALASNPARALIVRTASFFSPYDGHNFAVHLVSALQDRREFYAVSDCFTSPTYVPDLVSATLDLVIDDEAGLWHMVNQGSVSWAEFAVQLADAMALPTRDICPRPARSMGFVAERPKNASLTSERGQILPRLTSAIERFAKQMS